MKGIIDLLKKTGGLSASNSTLLVALWGGLFCLAVTYGQPPAPPPAEFEDGTGTIRIRVETCDWVQSQPDENGRQVVETFCGPGPFDPQDDWEVVGGGAEICCNSGARLSRSSPDTDGLWWANSTDKASEQPHHLRAWVVLMQLIDGNGLPFPPVVFVSDDNNNRGLPDNSGVAIGYGTIEGSGLGGLNLTVIGGGAQITPEGGGQGGIVESRPIVMENGELAWRVGANLAPGDLSVRAWLVGMDLCPDKWNGGCLSYPVVKNLISEAASSRNEVNFSIPPSWIATSIGGQAIAQGSQERYLEDLIPLNGGNLGFTVGSKSGDVQNSGTTLGTVLVIGLAGAPYQNNIRFKETGTALARHPILADELWQTHRFPLSDIGERGRWHLDAINSVMFLLRNGSPGQGEDCAYWAGGNDVRVAVCDESNPDFHWVKQPDHPGMFALRNWGSHTLCLDNDNAYGISQLTLETCHGDFPPDQTLFLDAGDTPPPFSAQNLPFRFEELSYWNSSASLALDSVVKTDGESGLSIGGSGYRVVNSVPVRTPLAGFGSTLLLDVYVPGEQPNPYWLGAVQVYASCPEAEMNNVYLGQSELTGLPTEAFSTLEYPLSEEIRDVLSQNRDDCFFSVAVNMNATPENPVLDNLRFIP